MDDYQRCDGSCLNLIHRWKGVPEAHAFLPLGFVAIRAVSAAAPAIVGELAIPWPASHIVNALSLRKMNVRHWLMT